MTFERTCKVCIQCLVLLHTLERCAVVQQESACEIYPIRHVLDSKGVLGTDISGLLRPMVEYESLDQAMLELIRLFPVRHVELALLRIACSEAPCCIRCPHSQHLVLWCCHR